MKKTLLVISAIALISISFTACNSDVENISTDEITNAEINNVVHNNTQNDYEEDVEVLEVEGQEVEDLEGDSGNVDSEENSGNVDSEGVSMSETDDEVYEQWAMDFSEYGGYADLAVDTDCFSTFNQTSYGGDLLSSLIVDQEVRNSLASKSEMEDELDEPYLDVYTKKYIKNLEASTAAFTRNEYSKNFYAFSVCNVEPSLDMVAGYLADSKEELPAYINGEAILLMINNDEVYELDLQINNKTATGGETSSCLPSIEGENMIWECFTGFYSEDPDFPDNYPTFKRWTISKESKILDEKSLLKDTWGGEILKVLENGERE